MKKLLAIIIVIPLLSCDKNNNLSLFFSVEDDIALGKQVSDEIASDPNTYPILNEDEHPEAYAYLNALTDEILNSGEVQYKSEFAWQMHIIDQDVLNAFATPGGYIYVYTGLIKYLDNVDDLAGVLGHEIAHSDLRHTSRNLQKIYGIQFLVGLLLGENPNTIAEIAAGLATNATALKFSRDHEAEADDRSVEYLTHTDYACDGAASFFEKLISEDQVPGVPEFLSTHPDPENRVNDIHDKAEEENCDTTVSNDDTNAMTYQEFKDLL